MIKLLVIGDVNVGKTQIIHRFTQNKFDDNYKPTIGSDFSLKILNIDGNEMRIQIWDMMGSDRSVMNINNLFVKGASGALVVADITDRLSIESAAEWK